MIASETFCYRLNSSLALDIQSVNASREGIFLASLHRSYIRERVNDYDLFLYQEDAMVLRFHSFVAWLAETKAFISLYGTIRDQ